VAGVEVARIETTDNAHVLHAVDGRRITARFCICAVAPHDLAALRPEFHEYAAFEPSPYVSVYLWLDRKLGPERFWALMWSPDRLNYDFYDLSNIRPAWKGRPSVIASNIIYSHRADAFTDEEIVAATLDEIAAFAPGVRQAQVRHAAIHRIPMAIVCPTPGFERKRPATRTSTGRLYLAGDWTRTHLPSSMESAVCSGFRAAEAVLADLGRGESIALAPREADGLAGLLRAL
jgi:15-cis-phytoene desaturase